MSGPGIASVRESVEVGGAMEVFGTAGSSSAQVGGSVLGFAGITLSGISLLMMSPVFTDEKGKQLTVVRADERGAYVAVAAVGLAISALGFAIVLGDRSTLDTSSKPRVTVTPLPAGGGFSFSGSF